MEPLPPLTSGVQGLERRDRSCLGISDDVEIRPAVNAPTAALQLPRFSHLHVLRARLLSFDTRLGGELFTPEAYTAEILPALRRWEVMMAAKSGWNRSAVGAAILLAVGLLATGGLHALGHDKLPLFDGIALPPPPYRDMSPPPERASNDQPPLSGEAVVSVGDATKRGASVQTADGQVAAFFSPGSLRADAAANRIRIRVEPVELPPDPPAGFSTRGNVNKISAIQEPNNIAATLTKPFHVVI
jgi:hypothetical protein